MKIVFIIDQVYKHGGTEKGALGRYKQWLAMLSQAWPQAQFLFEKVKRESSYPVIVSLLIESTQLV